MLQLFGKSKYASFHLHGPPGVDNVLHDKDVRPPHPLHVVDAGDDHLVGRRVVHVGLAADELGKHLVLQMFLTIKMINTFNLYHHLEGFSSALGDEGLQLCLEVAEELGIEKPRFYPNIRE